MRVAESGSTGDGENRSDSESAMSEVSDQHSCSSMPTSRQEMPFHTTTEGVNLSSDAELETDVNLVKIASHVKSKPGDAINQEDQHTTTSDWLDADCPVDFLNV